MVGDTRESATSDSIAASAASIANHAVRVGRLRDAEDDAASAVAHVRLDTNAYGRLCAFLPTWLEASHRNRDQAIKEASDTLHAYTRWLQGASANVTQGRQVSVAALAELGASPQLGPSAQLGPGERSAQPGRFAAGPAVAAGSANPLVAPTVDSTMPYSGIGILETIAVLGHAYQSGSWVEGGLGLGGLALEATFWYIDPVGMLVAAGFGVFVEHVTPLRELLDSIAGDPDEVNAHAQTWRNVAAAEIAIGKGLLDGLRDDVAAWDGQAADTYRQYASETAGHITALGKACEGTAFWVSATGALVAVVRTIVRDLVAQCVAVLLVRIPLWIAETLLSVGLAIPLVGAQVAATVARFATQIARLLRALLSSMRNLSPMIRQMDDIMLMLSRMLIQGRPLVMGIHGGSTFPRGGTPRGRLDTEIDEILALARRHDIPIDEAALRQAALNHNQFPNILAEVRGHIDDVVARRAAGLPEGPPGGVRVPDEALAEGADDIRRVLHPRTADRAASEVLADALGPPPGPRGNYDAHHIISTAEGGEMMQRLRVKLAEAGVGENTAPNGAWLLRRTEDANPTAAMPHNQYIHAGNRAEYEHTIFSRLGHLDGQPFLNELAKIKTEMLEGTFRMLSLGGG